ncbi:hypothetical protein D6D26_03492 [Aureobasidium pullulans]|nr:hypothetical protein D6D26_03492 [Aureobasidium pullulans]
MVARAPSTRSQRVMCCSSVAFCYAGETCLWLWRGGDLVSQRTCSASDSRDTRSSATGLPSLPSSPTCSHGKGRSSRSNSATTRSTVDCHSRFIGADSVSLAPRVTRAQARVCRRETTGAWPKHLNVSANWQLREASQQHLVIALHGKRRLHTTLHQTLDCRRLVFLGRRPLAVSTYQSQDP